MLVDPVSHCSPINWSANATDLFFLAILRWSVSTESDTFRAIIQSLLEGNKALGKAGTYILPLRGNSYQNRLQYRILTYKWHDQAHGPS